MLMELGPGEGFAGSVLQLGRQNIGFSETEMEMAAQDVGFPLARHEPTSGLFDDQGFFGRLGFEKIDSLDASDFEGASILFDLNSPEIPEIYRSCFDVVFDGGTLEHVFHVPNALRSVAAFLKTGGLVAHALPVHNYFEHGFYCFSPTLLHDFYGQNGFEIVGSQLLRFDVRSVNRGERIDLLRENVSGLCRIGSLDSRCYGVFFVARKKEEGQGAVIPQQDIYLQKWAGDHARGASTKSRAMRLLRKIAKRNKHLLTLYMALNARLAIRSIRWQRI